MWYDDFHTSNCFVIHCCQFEFGPFPCCRQQSIFHRINVLPPVDGGTRSSGGLGSSCGARKNVQRRLTESTLYVPEGAKISLSENVKFFAIGLFQAVYFAWVTSMLFFVNYKQTNKQKTVELRTLKHCNKNVSTSAVTNSGISFG